MIPATTALLDAIAFAAHKHRDQRRKDAEASPYINHPIALAHLLASTGGVADLAVLQAAILHDTIEDTQTTHAELSARFGVRVADIVAEVSDDKTLAKQDRKRGPDRLGAAQVGRSRAGQAGRQDLQPARRGAVTADRLVARAAARIFRLGPARGRRSARRQCTDAGGFRRGLRAAALA